MKQATIAILLICMLSFSHAANMRRNSPNTTPLDKLELASKESKFASNLFVTINLSLQSGGKVDEVIDFVRKAKTEQITQKNDLTTEYNLEKARLEAAIEDIQTELDVLNGQLQIVLENIEEYSTNVSQLTARLNRLEVELQGIQQRREALEQARQNDIEAFRNRQRRDTNTINALTEIIPALENLRDNGNAFLEKSHEEILLALKKIPENRPIQMLVQLSTKFNSAKLSDVIEKLVAILEQVQEAKAQDAENDETSNSRYMSLVVELEALRNAKQKDINAVRTELDANQVALKHNTTFRNQLTTNIKQQQGLKETTEQVLDQTTLRFETNVQAAVEAIEALTAALNILTENQGQLEAQEQVAEEDQE